MKNKKLTKTITYQHENDNIKFVYYTDRLGDDYSLSKEYHANGILASEGFAFKGFSHNIQKGYSSKGLFYFIQTDKIGGYHGIDIEFKYRYEK